MKKADMLIFILAMLLLSSCGTGSSEEASISEATAKNPQLQAFEKAEQAGLLDKKEDDGIKNADAESKPEETEEKEDKAKHSEDTPQAPTEETQENQKDAAGADVSDKETYDYKDEEPLQESETVTESVTEDEAKGKVEEPIDDYLYKVEKADTKLELAPEGETEKRSFYVFKVTDKSSEEIGQIAVDSKTGEKYTYLGDGKITSYAEFPFQESKPEITCDWPGNYESPAGTGLNITENNDGNFSFEFSDGTKGVAHIYGGTAKSEDGEINFLISEETVTVAGGGFTGNYDKTES